MEAGSRTTADLEDTTKLQIMWSDDPILLGKTTARSNVEEKQMIHALNHNSNMNRTNPVNQGIPNRYRASYRSIWYSTVPYPIPGPQNKKKPPSLFMANYLT